LGRIAVGMRISPSALLRCVCQWFGSSAGNAPAQQPAEELSEVLHAFRERALRGVQHHLKQLRVAAQNAELGERRVEPAVRAVPVVFPPGGEAEELAHATEERGPVVPAPFEPLEVRAHARPAPALVAGRLRDVVPVFAGAGDRDHRVVDRATADALRAGRTRPLRRSGARPARRTRSGSARPSAPSGRYSAAGRCRSASRRTAARDAGPRWSRGAAAARRCFRRSRLPACRAWPAPFRVRERCTRARPSGQRAAHRPPPRRRAESRSGFSRARASWGDRGHGCVPG
jgi:hypothetical protein